jgi:hypothetical protein
VVSAVSVKLSLLSAVDSPGVDEGDGVALLEPLRPSRMTTSSDAGPIDAGRCTIVHLDCVMKPCKRAPPLAPSTNGTSSCGSRFVSNATTRTTCDGGTANAAVLRFALPLATGAALTFARDGIDSLPAGLGVVVDADADVDAGADDDVDDVTIGGGGNEGTVALLAVAEVVLIALAFPFAC